MYKLATKMIMFWRNILDCNDSLCTTTRGLVD